MIYNVNGYIFYVIELNFKYCLLPLTWPYQDEQ
jgi:hypothetical protein